MIDDSVQAENADDFGMSEHDIRPSNNGSDDEKDEKRDDDTCVKCEKTFNRIGGIYDGVLSYCNDCHATSIVKRKMTKLLWILQLILSDLF